MTRMIIVTISTAIAMGNISFFIVLSVSLKQKTYVTCLKFIHNKPVFETSFNLQT